MSNSPEYPELMPGFHWQDVDADGVRIRAAVGGSGPPLLLLHGHPQTHLTWHKVVPALAKRFTVVATDLRGYGDSEKLPGDPAHANYSKRAMTADQVAVMTTLGFDRFDVVAHDRGARVAHRMALDHPDRVARLVLLDIAPTATMYAQTTREFATRYFWWFFLIQPFDLPERMIAADPDHFLDRHLAGQIKVDGSLDPRVVAEYRRCYRDPSTRHAICEDYRAAASIDLEHDAADDDRRIEAPLLLLWGEYGTVGTLFDVMESWRSKARDVRGCALPCGHSPQEEVPELLLAELGAFLT
ncbi:hydrolase [Sphingopyxis sp. H038]|uniref:alpha/beta fold hydrolase n=1 Tax=unclassified Sphingopyxis TaxID=2614943 RepID=UPI0007307FF3|nr:MULTISPECIES: alpha/beta hydrolase [unclassified Sphingopyxis]KTE01099.1 hydrolase [Sphingopyxis sp. H012]KTE12446.1 hydrolase [Sphingopyxis sp. H053]KTE14148.1 hydrolase [Sphingopyxis sp. H093]KTE21524.1 hydrolase [Sphingopyxis sp. H080]KTE32504.1 hydrolase [Sphingopyxis sp. H038]